MKPTQTNSYSVKADCPTCGSVTIFDYQKEGQQGIGNFIVNQPHHFDGKAFNRIMWFLLRCSNCYQGERSLQHYTDEDGGRKRRAQ